MGELTPSFWLTIIVYLVTFAASQGSISQRIKALEKKVDMHNNFAARMPVIEEKVRNLEENR